MLSLVSSAGLLDSHQFPLKDVVHSDGYVYIEFKKGMYELKQAAILAYRQLEKELTPYGYYACKYSLGLWKHTKLAVLHSVYVLMTSVLSISMTLTSNIFS